MKYWALMVIPMVLLGLVLGPVIGMFISGDGQDEFIGFLYGLRIGPVAGLLVGIVLGVLRKKSKHPEEREVRKLRKQVGKMRKRESRINQRTKAAQDLTGEIEDLRAEAKRLQEEQDRSRDLPKK